MMSDLWKRLVALAQNFWWSWDAEATRLFRHLDPEIWSASKHTPLAVLDTLGETGTLARLEELGLAAWADSVLARFQAYVDNPTPWADSGLPVQQNRGPVAYFCAEYGIHESLPIYAGGLGILAGDHTKSASDLGVPMVAIGLLYREGYFTQLIDAQGRQRAFYRRSDFEQMALEPVVDSLGRPRDFVIPGAEGDIHFFVWGTQVGRVPLILLDAGPFRNRPEVREVTQRLYGGTEETRILQEILLGVGGIRVLRELGIAPSVFHMNEGHCAFLTLELMRERVAAGVSYETAREEIRKQTVFTTHTPVPAGHDRFSVDSVEKHLGWLREELGVDRETFQGLGRVNPDDDGEPFGMTPLALRMSRSANGVSELHGRISRAMWQVLWPEKAVDDVPIRHITNGVHVPTWIAPEMGELFDSQMGDAWRRRPWDPASWEGVDHIPDSLLWAVLGILKRRLITYARKSVVQQRMRHRQYRGLSMDSVLDPDTLTIGFARRFATYKRGDLIFRDLERARRLFANASRPVQILFAGKAHPQDYGGGDVLQRVVEATYDPVLSGHVVFLPDYGIDVARHLVQGVDVWLNTPRRPREASGTSGQKVPLNGGINVSTIDGWWCEGYNGENGWNIGDDRADQGPEWEQDQRDYDALFHVLENEIVPRYYDHDADGLPSRWLKVVKASIKSVGCHFNSLRMVRDYVSLYWP
jgi:starch phosphorylase